MNALQNLVGRLTKFFSSRFPDTQSILGVYAVIVALIYSWTLITSFYKVPSWLFYLTLGQIASMYAYFFLMNLAESVLILIAILLLEYTIFLPLKNKNEFQSRSILIVFAVLVSSMARLLIYRRFEASDAFVSGELTWWLVTFLVGLLSAVFIPKIKKLRDVIENIAERLIILLYIYIPLSLISLVVVVMRNIN